MDKLPVCYGQGVAPYCPRCGSGEYLHNEDGSKNDFCGQCGCPLDWTQEYNEDTDQVREKLKCGDCRYYGRSVESENAGVCKAKGICVRRSKPACKKHFKRQCIYGEKRRVEMDTETMIRNLKKVEEDHKNDKVFTGQLNIAEMAHDTRNRLEELKPYEDTGLTPEQIMELKERDTAKEPEPAPMGMDGMVCPACGEKALPWDRFCGECGQRLREDE